MNPAMHFIEESRRVRATSLSVILPPYSIPFSPSPALYSNTASLSPTHSHPHTYKPRDEDREANPLPPTTQLRPKPTKQAYLATPLSATSLKSRSFLPRSILVKATPNPKPPTELSQPLTSSHDMPRSKSNTSCSILASPEFKNSDCRNGSEILLRKCGVIIRIDVRLLGWGILVERWV